MMDDHEKHTLSHLPLRIPPEAQEQKDLHRSECVLMNRSVVGRLSPGDGTDDNYLFMDQSYCEVLSDDHVPEDITKDEYNELLTSYLVVKVHKFGLAIHQNDHQARRRFVEWAQNEIAVVPDFHKRILFSDEAHFWLNGYVNKQNCRIWSEANPQVYVETPLHPEKLTVWCALWAGGILLQKR
ncbi:hypothetical protein TNCV_2615921 [Trichonephila clavipes]|nr:hypothetical protein TNCV_2615921 [Trichonephila clavipes]